MRAKALRGSTEQGAVVIVVRPRGGWWCWSQQAKAGVAAVNSDTSYPVLETLHFHPLAAHLRPAAAASCRETLQTSLSTSLPTIDDPAAAGKDGPVHPELAEPTASSSSTAQGSNGSSKGGAATTPPPSPAPDASKSKPEPTKASSSSSSSSSAKKDSDSADKAAAVAALNAALKAAPAAGSGAGSSKRPDAAAAGSSDEMVDMADVLAQLRRAMEADVARDVMKMKENTTSSPAAAGPAAGSNSSSVQDSPPGDSAAAAAAAGSAASAEGGVPTSLDPTATPQEDSSAPDVTVAAAADGIPGGAGADSSSDEDSTGIVTTQLSSSAVGEAGTYSRMLPKGWGPRLGVGFSNYPRSRNNIVSSASLGVSMSSPVPTTGDAAGAANSSTEAV